MPYIDAEEQRAYQRKWMAQRRAEYLVDKACVDCGGHSDLEIDHVDARLKITHRVWSWSEARRTAELAKCVVRCHSCHVEKSKLHDWKTLKHGTTTMYGAYGCRCEPCRQAKSVSNTKYR